MTISKAIFIATPHGMLELELKLKTTDKDGYAHSRVTDRLEAINLVMAQAQDAIKAVLKSEGKPVLWSDWKDAIIDAAVVNWTLAEDHESNPKAAVGALLAYVEQLALDPSVSKPAAQWRAREEQLKQLVREASDMLNSDSSLYSSDLSLGDWIRTVQKTIDGGLPAEGTCKNCDRNDVFIMMCEGRLVCVICKSYNVIVSEKKETTT